jgi:hypothetical protein
MGQNGEGEPDGWRLLVIFWEKKPKPAMDSEDWERFNMQLVSYLQTHMHPTLQHHLDDVTAAERAWEVLRVKFREHGTVGQLNLL